MVEKKPSRKQSSEIPVSGSSEQIMREISKILSERKFDSIDEMNQYLRENVIGKQIIPTPSHSDLDRAQDLIYQAYEAPTKAKMIKLAQKALDISADCADGYVLLAELNTQTLAEAWALYEAGVRAGQRALGDEFEKLKGHFWGNIETRPYMRARIGLAITLWKMGRLEEAADHMATMLELNLNDNQGVRLLYINLLAELGDDKRMNKLLEQYNNDWSAYWRYGEALYVFKQEGAGDKADDLLSDAISCNRYVPLYLLGKKKLPKQHVSSYTPGDENEAIVYSVDGIRPWSATKGALDWLQKMFLTFDEVYPPST